jgi:hypothetical protein
MGGGSCVGGGGVMARGGATGTTLLLLSFDSSRIRSEYVACYKKDEERQRKQFQAGRMLVTDLHMEGQTPPPLH